MSNKEHWDAYHEKWKDRRKVPANPRIIKAILHTLDIKDKKILEVGSGSGRDTIYLAKQGADCYLVDYVEIPLKIATNIAERVNVRISTIKCDARSLPFEDGHFDLVYSQGLIEHFTEPEVLIKEQMRVLKKDGYLLVDAPQKYHVYTLIKHLLMFLNKWIPGWETEYTIGQLERLVRNCGLQIKSTYGDWSYPPLLLKMVMIILKIPRKSSNVDFSQNSQHVIAKFKKMRFAHYTFQHIGVVGKK